MRGRPVAARRGGGSLGCRVCRLRAVSTEPDEVSRASSTRDMTSGGTFPSTDPIHLPDRCYPPLSCLRTVGQALCREVLRKFHLNLANDRSGPFHTGDGTFSLSLGTIGPEANSQQKQIERSQSSRSASSQRGAATLPPSRNDGCFEWPMGGRDEGRSLPAYSPPSRSPYPSTSTKRKPLQPEAPRADRAELFG